MIDDIISVFIVVFLISMLYLNINEVKNYNFKVVSFFKNKHNYYLEDKRYFEEMVNGRSRVIYIYTQNAYGQYLENYIYNETNETKLEWFAKIGNKTVSLK